MYKFHGILEKFENNLYNYHIKVPPEIVSGLKSAKMKRFLCKINEGQVFHSSLIPAGDQIYFIKVNKALRDRHQISEGSKVIIHVTKDDTPYGMPLPEELRELFLVDPEGDQYFHNLTPGKQRSLIFLVNKLKSPDKRIEKSIIILEHLKEHLGNLDFKILHQDFKNKKDT